MSDAVRDAALLLGVIASSLMPAMLVFLLAERRHRLRTALNLSGAAVKLALIALIAARVRSGAPPSWRAPFLPGADLELRADGLSVLFAALSGVLWLVTTLYAVGYLEGSPHRSRFFGFFNLCVASTMGIALAGNLATFLVAYELLTLATYPLVAHRGTPAARAGAAMYLRYAIGGGLALLLGTTWLHATVGTSAFTDGGVMRELAATSPRTATAIFWLLIGGLGVKAALVPLHRWLPQAMVAPAPVSALLHAVAVVKAGVFGIVRVVHDVCGRATAESLGVLEWLALWAAATILWGSARAMRQPDLKRRLAYSTVSQLSYVTLGIALLHPTAVIGGVVHIVHQGLMKITLFFCAGNLAEEIDVHGVRELSGVGRRMPVTMGAFTVAALGMIGVPPLAGFVSKWYLATGAIATEAWWVLAVLAASTLLNAGYFLPLLRAAWFRPPAWAFAPRRGRLEGPALLIGPTLATAVLVIAAGVLAWWPESPLQWTKSLIAGALR